MTLNYFVYLVGSKCGSSPGGIDAIKRNVPTGCIYKADEEIKAYGESWWEDVWVLCYHGYEDEIDNIVFGTGYSVLENISNIKLQLSNESCILSTIDKPLGLVAFQYYKVSKEDTERFKNDLNDDLFEQLLKQGVTFDDTLFSLEKNEWYLASYVVNTIIVSGYLTDGQISELRKNVESNEVHLPQLAADTMSISYSVGVSYDYVAILTENILC